MELHSKSVNIFHSRSSLQRIVNTYLPTLSLLASCSTVLIYGQIYSFYSMKVAYMVSFFVFVIGSGVAASAPNSTAFIVGRALSGLGSAGVFAGSSM